MHIAISLNICVGRCAEVAMIPRIAAAGFDGLDFNFCDLLDRIDWCDARAAGDFVQGLAESARAAKLTWVQAHGPFSQTPRDERIAALSIPAIRACGRLGIPWMVLHPDVFSGPFDQAHVRALRDANLALFRSLLPECEKAGVGIAIENIFDSAGRHGTRNSPRYYGAVPDELCALIDALDHPLIGACWDTGHARMMGLDQRTSLAALGRRLKTLHVQENDGRGDDHMLPYVNGPQGVDWRGLAEGLRLAGYQGALTYEAHNSFLAMPEPLLDATLRYGAQIARYLAGQVTRAAC